MIKSFVKLLISTVFLAIIMIIAILYMAPSFISESEVKSHIFGFIKKHTDLDSEMDGKVSFSLLPDLEIKIENLVLINPETNKKEKSFKNLDLHISIIDFLKDDIGLSAEFMVDGMPIKSHLYISDFDSFMLGKSSEIGLILVDPVNFNLRGIVTPKENNITISNIRIFLESTKGEGFFEVDTSGVVPNLSGVLSFDRLDIDEVVGTIASVTIKENKPTTQSRPSTSLSVPVDKKLPWDVKPYNFDILKKFNADIKAEADSILVRGIKIGKTNLNLSVKDSLMNFRLVESSLYGGRGSGGVVIDSTGDTAKIQKQFSFSSIDIGGFIRDAYKFDRIEGEGNLEILVSSQGNNEFEMVSNLQGNGSVNLKNGSIKNVDFLNMNSNSQESLNKSLKSNNSTEVSSAAATFLIQNGVVSNDDLVFEIPSSQMRGGGIINLPAFTIDYSIIPTVKRRDFGITIPIRFTGDLRHPKSSFDAKRAVLENALENNKNVKKLDEQLQKHLGTGLKDVFKGLFGN